MGQPKYETESRIKVLLIEDDKEVADSIKQSLSKYFTVDAYRSAEEVLEIVEDYSAIICDLKLPGMSGLELLRLLKERGFSKPFIIITAFGDIPTAVEATKLGAADFIRKGDITPQELVQKIYSVVEDVDYELIYESQSMRNIVAVAKQVAKTDSCVLITGESGVGKEVLARFIHRVSPRAFRPFVAVNMSAIPDTLLESELFGYEKGAFTGAERRKIGKFELANGGTILLDEIGDMSLSLQPKILRVIQEKKIERLGGVSSIKIDVRIISTTNKDLESMIKEGKFREDLYFRLAVVPIKIPPLRERKEDIPPIVNHFISKLSRKYGVEIRLGDEVIEKLMSYDWPGNVRELQNVVERAFVISFSSNRKEVVIEPDHIILSPEDLYNLKIPEETTKPKTKPEEKKFDSFFDDLNIKNMEKIFILKALERTGGNKTRAAELLGITVRTLRNKLKELKMEESEEEK